MDGVEARLQRRRATWVQALNESDLEMYGDLVAEDLVWLPPSGDVIQGRAAFLAWLRPFFERFSYRFRVDSTELRIFDGWSVEAGLFVSELTPVDGGEAQRHEGRYTVLWRLDLEDGVWRIERYIDGFPQARRHAEHEADG